MAKTITVSQLNRYIGRILSTDALLMNVAVSGEISRITRNQSGHWYFDLKDSSSRIRCFLAASRVPRLRFEIDEGMEVVVYGNISVYEAGGSYSVNVSDIQPVGEGALAAAFEKLNRKLEAEGLFDEAHNRPLPRFPKKIGVVTSPTGAAVRDIITTIRRRYPFVDILLYPAKVQGEGSAETVCAGIEFFNQRYPETDILIIGRGGGSLEELWTFNEESVARAVYASGIPVISAVGHETDFVITDRAADVRAATPTAAGMISVPHIDELRDRLNVCSPQSCFNILISKVDVQRAELSRLRESAESSMISMLNDKLSRLRMLKLDLDSANPLTIIGSGYAIIKGKDGGWILRASDISAGDRIKVMMSGGTITAEVKEVELDG